MCLPGYCLSPQRRTEFHEGSPLSIWFTVPSVVPRTVQAPSHCPGCSGLFAEWMGLAEGRQQRHRGSNAWLLLPGALRESTRPALDKNNPGLFVFL